MDEPSQTYLIVIYPLKISLKLVSLHIYNLSEVVKVAKSFSKIKSTINDQNVQQMGRVKKFYLPLGGCRSAFSTCILTRQHDLIFIFEKLKIKNWSNHLLLFIFKGKIK